MQEVINIVHQLSPYLPMSNIAIFIEIILSTYCISGGGVTHKNIARWTGSGGSYRSVQRFFGVSRNWKMLNLLLFKLFRFDESGTYLLCFDETTEGKSGNCTHQLGRFYSSLFGKPIKSICALAYSLIDVQREQSFVMNQELLEHKQSAKAGKVKSNNRKKKQNKPKNGSKKQKQTTNNQVKRKAGRPKGSQNKPKVLGVHFQVMARCITNFKEHLQEVGLANMPLTYVVGDGQYGNRSACKVCRDQHLHLLSKLQKNAALYLP